jgi:DNA-directed RNA polymerase specialized sigma24 family protein
MKALMAAQLESANLPEADLERIFREHHGLVFRAAYRVTGNADDAEDVLQTVFLRMMKRGALARLNPRIAEMFMLRFFDGKDNPEIARLLETTPGTVAVTLSRTRDRLEKEYRAYLGGVA